MATLEDLLKSIQESSTGLNITQIIDIYSNIPRRTAQRWLRQLTNEGKLVAVGEGPSRHYRAITLESFDASSEGFPSFISISPDSRDILAYIQQPLEARKPVGYQRDFLDTYEPNRTEYLSEPLRRQLHKMGDSGRSSLPAGTYGRDILNRLLIDLSWASSHLEGNTYSRLDTRELIEHGKVAAGKDAAETQMILNHKAAIEMMVANAEAIAFNRYTLLNLHAALSENLLPNPADEGRIRQHIVEISQSVYHPASIPQQVAELLDVLLEKGGRIADPFEQSFFAMVHLPYLQPFADVNKRTSRLIANLPLIRANLCPLTFLGVPEKAYSAAMLGVYELTRIELLRDLYVWAYERSTQEYLAIRTQEFTEPDPTRLAYRDAIKNIVREAVVRAGEDTLEVVERKVAELVNETDREKVRALINDELRRLHEGVLSRYGLRPTEFEQWRRRKNR